MREQEAFRELLAEATEIVEGEGIDYVVAGSLCSNHWGRPSAIGDIDLLVAPQDAKRLLKAFDAAGFDTSEDEPQWLFKAKKKNKTVDIIFEMEGALYLDDPLLEHATIAEIEGTMMRLMSAEDFIVSQAVSTGEDTSDYWYNALAVIAKSDIDWDYLVERASRGPRRVLSLLLYAQSDDKPIPEGAIRRLFESLYGR
ncbi:MAG: nucleotidyltransferase family protein [Actinomycetota bacterium]|nr:nucleotidyltransferase family protein [Actinomycetota bacterium]